MIHQSLNGLTSDEAARRLAEYGANAPPEAPALGIVQILLRTLREPMFFLLMAAAVDLSLRRRSRRRAIHGRGRERLHRARRLSGTAQRARAGGSSEARRAVGACHARSGKSAASLRATSYPATSCLSAKASASPRMRRWSQATRLSWKVDPYGRSGVGDENSGKRRPTSAFPIPAAITRPFFTPAR